MADSVNPWTYADWNLTLQGQYVQQFGELRAMARARDAGTTLGGPRPKPPQGVKVIERHFLTRRLVQPSGSSGGYGWTGVGPPVDGTLTES